MATIILSVLDAFQTILDQIWGMYNTLLPGVSEPNLRQLATPFLTWFGVSA